MSKIWNSDSLVPGALLFFRRAVICTKFDTGGHFDLVSPEYTEFSKKIEMPFMKGGGEKISILISADRCFPFQKEIVYDFAKNPLVYFLGITRVVKIYALTEVAKQQMKDSLGLYHETAVQNLTSRMVEKLRYRGPRKFVYMDKVRVDLNNLSFNTSPTLDTLLSEYSQVATKYNDQAAFAQDLENFKAADPKTFTRIFHMDGYEMHKKLCKQFDTPLALTIDRKASFLVTDSKTETSYVIELTRPALEEVIKSQFVLFNSVEKAFKTRKDFEQLMKRFRADYGNTSI